MFVQPPEWMISTKDDDMKKEERILNPAYFE
jgi:hypothetical protein